MRYAFAGDRNIALKILEFLIDKGFKPLALFVCDESKATHHNELVEKASLDSKFVFYGNDFKKNLDLIKSLNLDYIIGIHFPYIIPNEFLFTPKIGVINLHPAYLPYNKGWHTPSWAIIDGSKYGATLHFMDQTLDTGDIIHQLDIKPQLTDTADSLYKKVLDLEFQVFKEAFSELISLNPKRTKQIENGTSYSKKDLSKAQEIKIDQFYTGLEIINKLRGLTTNNVKESAYFLNEVGKKIHITINLSED
jgi:methionyl-tRNA formyltransferase